MSCGCNTLTNCLHTQPVLVQVRMAILFAYFFMCYVNFVDIDECETMTHNCDQVCSNTLGSFECKCNDGYSLDPDSSTCTG